jgi:hypothetical protein
MKPIFVVGRLVCVAALMFAMAGVAEAQATRTWVSGVGDDVNPCSRTAPCKTFAGAISKTATNGYIQVLDPGGYGAVTITKNITIDGTPFMAGVLAPSGGSGIIINGAGIKVTLRGLDIEGGVNPTQGPFAAFGVRILNSASVNIENCHITDFATAAIEYNQSTGGLLAVADTEIKRSTIGINVTNGRAMVNRVNADFNTTGIKANANAQITVRDSYVSGGGEGFNVAAVSSVVNVENTVVQANTFGVNAQNGTIRFSNSGILSNSNTGLFNAGPAQIISLSGNTLEGNPTPGAFTSTILKK